MLLTVQQFKELRAMPPTDCPRCRRAVRCNYCRDCGLEFEDGHAADCGFASVHEGHETYLLDADAVAYREIKRRLDGLDDEIKKLIPCAKRGPNTHFAGKTLEYCKDLQRAFAGIKPEELVDPNPVAAKKAA